MKNCRWAMGDIRRRRRLQDTPQARWYALYRQIRQSRRQGFPTKVSYHQVRITISLRG